MPRKGNSQDNNKPDSPTASSDQEEQHTLDDSDHTVIAQQDSLESAANTDAYLSASESVEVIPGAEAIPSASAASAETSLNISKDTDVSVPNNTDEYLDDNNFQRDPNLSPEHLTSEVPT